MITISYAKKDICDNQDIINDVAEHVTQVYKQRKGEAFLYRYGLTDEQHTQLQNYFPERMVLKSTAHATKYSSHALLAILNDYANVDAQHVINFAKQHGPTMSIGDPIYEARADHNCNLMQSSRDCMRFAVNHHKSEAKALLRCAIDTNKRSSLLCLDGSENCNFKAHTAIAVHSMYDIDMDTFAKIFMKHDLQQAFIYMYLPPGIGDKRYISAYSDLFKLEYNADNIRFMPLDSSIPYVHKIKTWRAWYFTTQVQIGKHTLVFERTKMHGPLTIIRVNKVYNFNTAIYMSVPVDMSIMNTYFVPCMRESLYYKFQRHQDELHHYSVPKHVVDALMSFASRQEESFAWPQFAVVAGGTMREIKIGNNVYHERWNININDYNNVVYSLFILAAVMRTDRTSGISSAFAHLKNWRGASNAVFAMRQLWHSMINLFPSISETAKSKNPRADINADFLWGYKIIYPEQYMTGLTHVHMPMRYKNTIVDDVKIDYPPIEPESDDEYNHDEIIDESDTTSVATINDFDNPIGDTPSVGKNSNDIIVLDEHDIMINNIVDRAYNNSNDDFDNYNAMFEKIRARRIKQQIDLSIVSEEDMPNTSDDSSIETLLSITSSKCDLYSTVHAGNTQEKLEELPIDIISTSDSSSIDTLLSITSTKCDLYTAVRDNHIREKLEKLAIPAHTESINTINAIDAILNDDELHNNFNEFLNNMTSDEDDVDEDVLFTKPIPVLQHNDFIFVHQPKEVHGTARCYDLPEGSHIQVISELHHKLPGKCIERSKSRKRPCLATQSNLVINNSDDIKPDVIVGKFGKLIGKIDEYYVNDDLDTFLQNNYEHFYKYDKKNAVKVLTKSFCFNIDDEEKIFSNTCNTIIVRQPHITPANFMPGHCLLQSLWESLPQHLRPSKNVFIRNFYFAGMHNARHSDVRNYTYGSVDAYINRGVYLNNDFVIHIAQLFSDLYNIHVTLHKRNGNVTYGSNTTQQLAVNITFLGDDNNGHYVSGTRITGGKATKFIHIVEMLKSGSDLIDGAHAYDITNNTKILDVSAAPGMLFMQLCDAFPHLDITCGHFKHGLPLHQNLIIDGNYVLYNNKSYKYVPYSDFTEIHGHYDVIINDSALPSASELIIEKFLARVQNLLNKNGTFISKSFGNIRKLWAIARSFEYSWKCKLESTATESYFVLKNFNGIVQFNHLEEDEKFADLITQHSFKPKPRQTAQYFEHEFFHDIKTNYDVYRTSKLTDKIFGFTAITGVASAGKTHLAVEMYPKALFIAPTNQCSKMHNIDYHVQSYTPHSALKHITKYETIVIDELSLFCLEYLHLIKTIHPNCHLVVVGDVLQVPIVLYNSKNKITQFTEIGVCNNNIFARTVPHDICYMLREKLGNLIYTKHTVESSIYRLVDPNFFLKFKSKFDKLTCQFIAFNDESVKNLVAKGYKASTITTYQGSRADTIIFMIDDKAITSRLINRTEWLYTAVTRARNQLVLYGDTQYIEQFFHIDSTMIRTYEEFSQLTLHQDVVMPTPELQEIVLPETVMQTDIVKVITTPDAVLPVLESLLIPFNPDTQLYNSPSELQQIEQGSIVTDIKVLMQPDKVITVGQIFPTSTLIINQVNNDQFETLRTAVGRYTIKTRRINDIKADLLSTDLLRGFCKGLYGNESSITKLNSRNVNGEFIKGDLYITREELMYHYKEYIISLQHKGSLNNVSSFADVEKPFDPTDELIAFINKRQGKFSDAELFDTSDKVGQGVASFSKRINLIYSAYARALLHKIDQLTTHNSDKRIILGVFGSNQELNYKYRKRMTSVHNRKWFCSDVSQWDSKWNKAMSMFMYKLFLYAGMPTELLDYWYMLRQAWKMRVSTREDKIKLYGEQKQFSGNPFTILENTVTNMALTFILYDFENFEFGLFKGDDSAICCSDARLTELGKQFLAVSDHKLKTHFDSIGDFASFLLCDEGMIPNLVRKTARVLGATYKDADHLYETRIGIKAHIETIDSEYIKNVACYVNSKYYKNLSVGGAQMLFDFLNTAMEAKWPKLQKPIKYIPRPEN